jgi:hypothetical protein
MAIELLTIDMFSDKIGQVFVIEETGVPALDLTLTEVSAMRNYANAPRAPFSLLFTASPDIILPQRMYTLKHAVLGEQSIFLVPIAGDSEKVTYQAIFN